MDSIIEKLRAIVGVAGVLAETDELLVYECDGLPQHKHPPRAVVFPDSTEKLSEILRLLAREHVSFAPRGAGTGLSGGALALGRGVLIEMARMRKILKIDEANRIAVVQTGVVNSHVSRAVASLGLHYVPDPSSQPTCTIGGNIAENAGGIHCLKYGTTTDHVLGVRAVLASGEIVDLGGAGTEAPGYDLLGVFIGSEGTFAIATEATLRLVPIPPAVRTMLAEFPEVNDASHAVSAIIAAGVMPAALEMMDREIIRAVEASVFAAGLPLDAGAALLIELDGIEAGMDEEADRIKSICLKHGARDCRLARDENERKKLWAARKGAFGAIGRISPDSMIQDAVVPRSRLPEVLDAAYRIAGDYQLRIANVFHAGDGNLHPLICFDSRFPDEVQRVREAGRALMEVCVKAGGSITGEHGVGLDKRDLLSLIFSEADMDAMLRVRAAFDPTGLCNPGKIIPLLRGCGEARTISQTIQAPAHEAGDLLGARASRPQLRGAASQGEALDDVPERQSLSARNGGEAATVRASHVRLPFDPNAANKQLAQIIGEENISASPSLPFFPSPFLVTPGTIAEVCEVMKVASSEGWAVVPAGAATWLDAGPPLERVNIVISTRRLNRIIEHEPADLIAIAEAGVTLKDFNDHLAQKGQWLPLDPPDDLEGVTGVSAAGRAGSSIGGVVATGLGGAQQFGYGPPRKHVIGMKVVLADGGLIKVGGRVVKNVAGYDLCKLFTGSYGTLGVIVELNFKLRPLPFETRTVLGWGEREDLLRMARRVIGARLFPVAIELLSPRLVREVGLPEQTGHLLLIRFAGSLSAVLWQTRATSELFNNEDGSKRTSLANDEAELWRSLAALPLRFSDKLVWRVGLRPDDVGTFLTRLNGVERLNGTYPRDNTSGLLWHAGVGDGRIRVIEDSNHRENESIDQFSRSIEQSIERINGLSAEAQRMGSALIIENAPAEVKNRIDIDAWGTLGPSRGLMQRVKQQLDPLGILSPGRFEFETTLAQSRPASAE